MPELEAAEYIILNTGQKTTSIRAVQARLRSEFKTGKIGYCVDFVEHHELGRNNGFKIMKPKSGGNHLLVQIRGQGDEPIVPHEYLGSIRHPRSKLVGERYVHFYIKRRQPTPPPVV